jgi:AcrR family transcriptional regulator
MFRRVSERGGSREDSPTQRLSRLPPGRHGLPREFVVRNQRDRLAAAIIATVAERGYHDATISQIAAAAGVSRRTFYTYFSSKEECFRETYQLIVDHLVTAAREGAVGEGDWTGKVRAKLRFWLDALAANPDLVRFLLIAPGRAGEDLAAQQREGIERAVKEICEGMPPPPATKRVSKAVEVAITGAVTTLVVRKVEAGEGERLPELLPEVLELAMAPYLGRADAIRLAREAS